MATLATLQGGLQGGLLPSMAVQDEIPLVVALDAAIGQLPPWSTPGHNGAPSDLLFTRTQHCTIADSAAPGGPSPSE